ncbi:unnamed protein product [Rhodiola kirilowii]
MKSDCQVRRDEIQSAIAKAVELRALHAALTTKLSLSHYPSSSSSPVSHSRPLSLLSAQEDYPVFTPTYDEEPLPAYHHQQIGLQNRPLSGNWDICGTDAANNRDPIVLWDYENEDDTYQQNGIHSHVYLDHKSNAYSCANRSITATRSPNTNYIAKSSRRSSLRDINSISSCNKCKPAFISTQQVDNIKSDARVPFTDPNLSYHSQPKNRGINLSWLFPRFKKKQHNKFKGHNFNFSSSANSPRRVIASEPASRIGSELGMISVERLKKKLIEAHESRDAALLEVAEMRSSLGELRQSLEYVEKYCEELKRALKKAGQAQHFQVLDLLQNLPNSIQGCNADTGMPVSEDVLIEGFLQVVSKARLSVKEFCKNLLFQIDDTDEGLVDSVNMLLQPYNLSLASKYSKLLLYHLEAIINQTLYEDFENCTFKKNGSPKLLDPYQQRQAQFASYLALQDLSWNEVLSKGTKYYSSEFSQFCDRKMSCIISLLNWTKPWPEQLLQAFFVTSKCVWLLHLLAFSFNQPLGILRVEDHRSFDAQYMDDILMERGKARGQSRVKTMVMPGFYVKDRVLRCKVICKYKPTSYK